MGRRAYTLVVDLEPEADEDEVQSVLTATASEHGNVISWSKASLDQSFNVVGVAAESGERWQETVEAATETEAEAIAKSRAEGGEERVVAAVVPTTDPSGSPPTAGNTEAA